MLPDGYLTGVLYRGILQNTLVPFASHYFGDNYRYQDDNATPHHARVVLDFLQQGNVTNITGINPEAILIVGDHYGHLLCPGLQPGPPSQTPGGLGQR